MGNNPVNGVDPDGRWSSDPDRIGIYNFRSYRIPEKQNHSTNSASNAGMMTSHNVARGFLLASISLNADLRRARVERLMAEQSANWLYRKNPVYGTVDNFSLYDPKLNRADKFFRGTSLACFRISATFSIVNGLEGAFEGDYGKAAKSAFDIAMDYGAWRLGGVPGFVFYGAYTILTTPRTIFAPNTSNRLHSISPASSTFVDMRQPVVIHNTSEQHVPRQHFFNQR
jgi:hypothetical protein